MVAKADSSSLRGCTDSTACSTRTPATFSMTMKGRPSRTGSSLEARMRGAARPAARSAAMMRACRITSAGPSGRAPGGGSRRTPATGAPSTSASTV
jgi:hypothetical protein